MKIIIPGGTGQVGTLLARAMHTAGHEVVVFSRRPVPAPWRMVNWDAQTMGAWAGELEDADAVINLVGQSVNCRYTARNRAVILESRVKSTQILGLALAQAVAPPRVWLQASTATLYAHRYDAANDEASGLIGGHEPGVPETWRFSIGVAQAWEAAATAAATPRTRQVLMRSAITMSPDPEGAFSILLGLVRHGLGGANGDGRQLVSWIHEHDFVRAVNWLITHEELSGPVNLAAPQPLPNADFMRALRQAWGARFGLPASRWMIEIGTFFMRTESELVLKSRRVVPGRLLASGFTFQYPDWPAAATELCQRWRATH